uniref:Equatorin n=1 Tax=Syphacia muris TaxID=451379 RepID=A0A0N5AEZ4_9BILA
MSFAAANHLNMDAVVSKHFSKNSHYFAIVYGSSLLMIIILATVISICLCSEKCLLHKLVRRRPSLDYIAKPEEVEHLAGMAVPSDDINESHTYEVNPEVSYKPKKDFF